MCWVVRCRFLLLLFFFKQKTAYEMRISDWSSDVCSSDLRGGRLDARRLGIGAAGQYRHRGAAPAEPAAARNRTGPVRNGARPGGDRVVPASDRGRATIAADSSSPPPGRRPGATGPAGWHETSGADPSRTEDRKSTRLNSSH